MDKKNALTDGPILRSLLLFALPMMAGNLLQQVYNITDTLIVGRFIGTAALAAVGSAYTLMTFLTSLIIGLCMGSGALLSQAFGAGDFGRLKQDLWISFWMILGIAVVIELAVYPGMDGILQVLQIPGAIYPLIRSYLQIIFSGIIFVFLYNFFAYSLRSIGNSQVPLYYLAVSSVLNIGLDLLAVVVLNLGIAGAAYATVAAQAFAGIGIAFYTLKRVPVLKVERRFRRFDSKRFIRILANDVLTGMQQSVMNFGILMIQGLVNTFGTGVMSAFAAAVKIDTVAYMPAQEFGNAFSLFISQNYGAGRWDRIRKGSRRSIVTSIAFCGLASFLVCLFAAPLMKCFVSGSETRIIAEGVRYLRIEGAMYWGIGFLFLWYGYFRAIGKPQISLVLTVVSLGTRVLLSYALAPHTSLGVIAIWISIPIGWALADLCGICFYKKYDNDPV